MKIHPEISLKLTQWIEKQRIFFVGTAPRSDESHVNVSPKGSDSFRILGPLEVAYIDYTGSAAETAAHVRENGRIVVMFCAFEGPPKILRLHGRGSIYLPGSKHFEELAHRFSENPGTRSIVHITVTRVADSCGYSVPFYDFKSHRNSLDKWAVKKGPKGIRNYQIEKNRVSIDDLPAIDVE